VAGLLRENQTEDEKMKRNITVALTAVASLLMAASAYAHSGGVRSCESCHTMHNSKNGSAMRTFTPQYQTGPYLLQAQDGSGSCLNCHEAALGGAASSKTISSNIGDVSLATGSAPRQRGPAGDFRWLTFSESNGHNIVAADYGYTVSTKGATAPGGSYPAANLSCASCHDPHGKYRRTSDTPTAFVTTGAPIAGSGSTGNTATATAALGSYRLLAGIGYAPKSTPGYAFTNDVPNVVAPATYNKSEAANQTGIAYGSGMSEWCANCHGSMHAATNYVSGQAGAGTVHPAGNNAKLTAAIAGNYASYVTSGIVNAGQSAAAAYNSLTPFELGSNDYAALKLAAASSVEVTWTQAADTNKNVSCLSCHRVHASGFASLLRYNVGEIITSVDTAGAVVYSTAPTTNSITTAAYYDRPASKFGAYARNACNKCHAKD
jgi:hypothetical protein